MFQEHVAAGYVTGGYITAGQKSREDLPNIPTSQVAEYYPHQIHEDIEKVCGNCVFGRGRCSTLLLNSVDVTMANLDVV